MGAASAVRAARVSRQRASKVNARMKSRGTLVEPHSGLVLKAGLKIESVAAESKTHFTHRLNESFLNGVAGKIRTKAGFRELSPRAWATVAGELFTQLSERFSAECEEASRKLPAGMEFTVAIEPVSISSRKAVASDVHGTIQVNPSAAFRERGWRPIFFKNFDPAITAAEKKIYEDMAGERRAEQVKRNTRIPSVRALRAQKPGQVQIADRVVTTGIRTRVLIMDPGTGSFRALSSAEQKKYGLQDNERKQPFIISKTGGFIALLNEGKPAKSKIHGP